MTITTGLITASAVYLCLARGQTDPGTHIEGDNVNYRGRVITTPEEARGLVAWLYGVRVTPPDLLAAAVTFNRAVISTHDTGFLDEPIGICVLNNGRMHFGEIYREISKSCCLFEALILDGRLLSESNTYPDGEPSIHVHWEHPLTGLRVEHGNGDVRVEGQLYGPGCLGTDWANLHTTLGRLSRVQLQMHLDAGGWTRHAHPMGPVYTRGSEAIWNGKPLDLGAAQRGLEAAKMAVA